MDKVSLGVLGLAGSLAIVLELSGSGILARERADAGAPGGGSIPLGTRTLSLAIRDRDGGAGLPGRVTILTAAGRPARPVASGAGPHAVRAGVVYVPPGGAQVRLPADDYVLWASRGTEWSHDRSEVELRDADASVELALRREVATEGLVAVDTHVHTLSAGWHGDATPDERVLTLAGEGVELALVTDHDRLTDLGPARQRAGLEGELAVVGGSEVTTAFGHVNACPLPEGFAPPPGVRTATLRALGARLAILNHPRWPDGETGISPFVRERLDPLTGRRLSRAPLPFDALEVVNASVSQPDPLALLRDWFGLLNRGERLAGVASSDSHTVVDPVGLGRTYVRSGADDPAALDAEQVLEDLARGRSSLSLGLLADVTVAGRWGCGETAPVGGGEPGVRVALRVAAASWARPRSAWVFVDGEAVVHAEVPAVDGAPTDVTLPLVAPLPEHDAWLVCVVVGDAVQDPCWPSVNAYTLAASNPIFVDRDGDGYRSPRVTALCRLHARLAAGQRLDAPAALDGLDRGAALQYLELLAERSGPGASRRAASERARSSGAITALVHAARAADS